MRQELEAKNTYDALVLNPAFTSIIGRSKFSRRVPT